jgi:hypothetical protein
MAQRIRKLSRLSSVEWLDLIRAELALLYGQWLVWTVSRGKLVTPDSPPVPAAGEVDPMAARLSLAMERVTENGPFRPQCLVRAVALDRQLRARGLTGSSVRVGAVHRGGRFAAHAWVDYQGIILGDREWNVSRFEELPDLKVSP